MPISAYPKFFERTLRGRFGAPDVCDSTVLSITEVFTSQAAIRVTSVLRTGKWCVVSGFATRDGVMNTCDEIPCNFSMVMQGLHTFGKFLFLVSVVVGGSARRRAFYGVYPDFL